MAAMTCALFLIPSAFLFAAAMYIWQVKILVRGKR